MKSAFIGILEFFKLWLFLSNLPLFTGDINFFPLFSMLNPRAVDVTGTWIPNVF